MPSGYQAQFLDALADRTFRDLLASWIGPEYPGPSRIDPDLQKIDITHQMPSLCPDVGDVPFNWQIKARSKRPREFDSTLLGCRCYRLYVEKRYVQDLAEISRNEPTFYLALAVVSGTDILSLANLPPAVRFEWYTVDLKQYCRTFEWKDPPSYIDIPIQNRLNLALFSLMWGANWVNNYIAPLRLDVRGKPEAVERLLDSLRQDISDLGAQASTLLTEAVPNLEALRDLIAADVFNEYTTRLAILGALRGITAMLLDSSGADQIETYSPEALAGTANLWLFSRTYHEFMRSTQLRGRQNKRLLPVKYNELQSVPRFFLATLFNVRTLYRILGATVRLVRMLEEGGGSDYSYWSDAIGAFEWIHVDSDGHIALDHSRVSARPDDLERLRAAEKGLLTGNGLSLSYGGEFGSLRIDDLSLGLVRPVCLFPPEDHLLEHPSELWSPLRHRVLE
ncbi:MAG TPA: hypothetical protein VGE04_00470 [Chloroflexia bacterium]|jgi:hypothetical protein